VQVVDVNELYILLILHENECVLRLEVEVVEEVRKVKEVEVVDEQEDLAYVESNEEQQQVEEVEEEEIGKEDPIGVVVLFHVSVSRDGNLLVVSDFVLTKTIFRDISGEFHYRQYSSYSPHNMNMMTTTMTMTMMLMLMLLLMLRNLLLM
jgi:hypothetical protein